MSGFGKFKEKLSCKEKFYCSFTCKEFSDKDYEHAAKWKRKKF